jgi:hypothetical protein
MNKVLPPTCNDNAALQALANNQKVGSYPNLLSAVALIQRGYDQYQLVGGNAFSVARVTISSVVATHLKAHYKNPPLDLGHITIMRQETEHRVCPMCGSMHGGTLDHLLPKNGYPEFSLFSMNLVPACKCNIKRKEILTGPNSNERILHPYFDDCLSERLIAARFQNLSAIPSVGLQLLVASTHPEYSAISFHVRSIVERTAIKKYLADRWSKLCRKPSLVVRALEQNPQNIAELKKILNAELNLLDDLHDGKNNWNSVFVAGLLDQNVSNWLFRQMSTLGRLPDAPLI